MSSDEEDYSDSSSDVIEDEDGAELTPALDAAILRTLAKIKRKEGVYGDTNVLEEELREAQIRAGRLGLTNVASRIKDKPYRLADYHREALLGTQDKSIANPSSSHSFSERNPNEPLTHVQSERLLRQEALSAFQKFGEGSDDDDEDEEGGLVIKRSAGGEVGADEKVGGGDEGYREFMLEMGGGEEEVRGLLAVGQGEGFREDSDDEESGGLEAAKAENKIVKEEVKAKRKAQKARADEDFLMDYILNRGWIDRSEEHVPTYDEITAPSSSKIKGEDQEAKVEGGKGSSHPWGALEEEDDFDDKAEEFETAYNFRFEEPGSSSIPTHPRQIPTLVRRLDDTRKSKRAAKAERKALERAAKEEEIKVEKGKKRREMERRMKLLREEVGEGVDWKEVERVIEGDWDEGEWERVVGGMLEKAAEDDEKPTWDDDLGDMEYDENDAEGDAELHVPYSNGAEEDDEGPVNMDADFVDDTTSKKKRRKNKEKSKSRAADVPLIEEEEGLSVVQKVGKVKEALEEYQALDHEDMIGDLPTRFKYLPSAPTSFGLTPTEILLATDTELNSLVSVKHIAPYRQGGLGVIGKGLGKRVRDLKEELKRRKWGEEDGPSTYGGYSGGSGANGIQRAGGSGSKEGATGEKRKTKRLGPKQRARLAAATGATPAVEGVQNSNPSVNASAGEGSKKSEERVKLGGDGVTIAAGVEGGAEGEGKKKRKKRKKNSGGEA